MVKYLKLFKEADSTVKNILSDYLGKRNWTNAQQRQLLKRLKESENEYAKRYRDIYERDYSGLGESEATFLLQTLSDLGIPDDLMDVLSSKNYWNARDDLPLVLDQKQYDFIPFMNAHSDIRWEILEPTIATAFVTGVTMSAVLETLYGGTKPAILVTQNSLKARILTATDHFVNAARAKFYTDNSSVIGGYYWEAILDDKTCEICMGLSGKTRAVDDSGTVATTLPAWAYPPVHRHCRCILIPIIKKWEKIKGGKNIEVAVKATMDGKLPNGMTYPEWFAKQTEAVKKKILGSSRYTLYKSGKTKITEFARKTTILDLAALGIYLNSDDEKDKKSE